MKRKAQVIPLQEFKDIVEPLVDWNHPNYDEEGDGPPWNLGDKAYKDFKVEFDWENYEFKENHHLDFPLGYKLLDNDVPVLFGYAGGDWEFPVGFCLYWDGKNIRAYVPTDGNTYNLEHKSAYGNNYEFDEDETLEDRIKPDSALMIADVNNRLAPA